MSGPSPLLFQCVIYTVNYFFSDFCAWYLIVALDKAFPLHCSLSGSQFVCQLFIERPCLAAIGLCWQETLVHYFFFYWSEMGSCPSWSIPLVFLSKTAPRCSDPGIDFFFCSVFEMCGLAEVFEFFLFFNFVPDHLVHLHCLNGLSCTLYFTCVFLGQLSDFLCSDCLSVFPVVLLFLLKRAISSAKLKFVRFPPSALIPLEMTTFLKTFSITAVNSIGESGSPCLTPLFIGNSSGTNLY